MAQEFYLLCMKKYFALISLLSLSGIGLAIPLNAAEAQASCVGVDCEVVFETTGEIQTWEVPDGVQELEFEVYGAQGGAGGGLGGFVSGMLSNLPSELFIAVGEAGIRGADSAGGFNGGGASGGLYGNPGSGGGASDIRVSTALTDRIVVAGGGGGYGGPVGGNGGPGGGEISFPGSTAQGEGGAGGTQLQGGAGGSSNKSEIDGEDGQLGLGGAGGSGSDSFGGAGGGGGYFGGGGGGADSDPCCTDAGGGGGGSSFADRAFVTDVTFTPETNVLDGTVILRYQLPPTITNFSYQQLEPAAASVSIEFDQNVSGVDESDFVVEECESVELSGADSSYSLAISECLSVGTVAIKANSIGESLNVPTTESSIQFELDQQAPLISFSYPEVSNVGSFDIEVETDETGIVNLDSISSLECDFTSEETQNKINISVSNCPEGNALVSFDEEFLVDSIGNYSLAEPREVQVMIDSIAPVIEFAESEITDFESEDGWVIKTATAVTISEASLSFSDFVFAGPEQCSTDHIQSENGITLQTMNCPEGDIQWVLPADSIADVAGNTSPSTDLEIELTIPKARVVEPPAEESTPEAPAESETEESTPEAPAESETEEESPEEAVDPPAESPQPPVQATPPPAPTPAPLPEIEQEIEAEEIVDKVSESESPESEQVSETSGDSERSISVESETQSEPEVLDEDTADEPEELKVDPPQPNQEVQVEIPDAPEPAIAASEIQERAEINEASVSPWAIAIASFVVLLLIFGVVFLTKNNRSRAID